MSGTMTEAAGERERYVADFRRFAERRGREVPPWVRPIREAAISRFAEIGFPSAREEDWKYTNVARLMSVPFRSALEPEDGAVDVRSLGPGVAGAVGARLVFVNGRFSAALSDPSRLPQGTVVQSLAEAWSGGGQAVEEHLARHASFDRNGFTALSTAFLADGALVSLLDRAVVEEPIEIVFLASATRAEVLSHPRLLVVCGRESRATLVETHLSRGDGQTLTNAVVEVVLADGARLDHVRVVRQDGRAAHVATTEVLQERDSRYGSAVFVLRCGFLRHNLNVRLGGQGAECSLDGLYLAAGEEFVDNHTAIDHAVPHGTSRELYKGILAGRAKAVFNGKVIVRRDAQKSDAQQTNKNLLLSEHAEIDTKPELQIFADDVKCAHGAAIGQLDPDALFYLKSRGIGDTAGRRLLTYGFGGDMIRRLPAGDRLRASLERALLERLERDLVEER